MESAVVAVRRENGTQIKAFIVPANGRLSPEDVNDHARKSLPAFKRPQVIEFIEALPRTASGKIMRSVLREKIPN
jgi:long-chain acyl-CoA synthetase